MNFSIRVRGYNSEPKVFAHYFQLFVTICSLLVDTSIVKKIRIHIKTIRISILCFFILQIFDYIFIKSVKSFSKRNSFIKGQRDTLLYDSNGKWFCELSVKRALLT